jgi:molybdopterin converting factor small subunit
VRIHVDILGLPALSDAVGGRRLDLEIPEGDLTRLIDAIAARGGEGAERVLFTDEGAFDPTVQLVVNGERFVSPGEGVELSDGDTVTVMMLVGGG